MLAAPKLDDIRCLKINSRALTRSLTPVSNQFTRRWIEDNLLDVLDGELIVPQHDVQCNPWGSYRPAARRLFQCKKSLRVIGCLRYVAGMRKCFSFSLGATLFLMVISVRPMAAATSQGDLNQEYSQVRKIALKDPKVQEAFQKANERLDEKIIEIDPALKPIVDREARAAAPVAVGTSKPKSQSRPTASPAAAGREHIVARGETLTSIAAHYKVKVAALEKVNHISDDRKLQVGQKLTIPAAESSAAQPAASAASHPAASASPQPKDNGGLWDRIKSNF